MILTNNLFIIKCIIIIYMSYRYFTNILRFFGILAAILGWIVIFISISVNPWFIFIRDAFSDLGGPNANMPWIYNYGLIITGLIIFLYSFAQLSDSTNKVESFASGYTSLMGIFLMLIGIFPSGTRPHIFVSTWFFIQGDLSILTWGIGLVIRRWMKIGLIFIIIGIISPLIGFGVEWPSAATVEAFGIIILDIWIIGMLKVHRII